uniref:Lipoprotein n=1 Tax=Gracilinema caldarium TaxID=215591 RepID=A0A7C3E8L3_9SPIR
MKNKTFFFLILAMTLLLSSCIEITQHIRLENNTIINNTRIVIQKALLTMAQSYGNDSDLSSLEFNDETIYQISEQIPKENFVSIKNANNELENGLEITVRYPRTKRPTVQNDDVAPIFYPYLKDKTLVVDFNNISSTNIDENNQMVSAILSGFKYRLFIDSSVLSSPKKATLYTKDEETTYTIPLINYSNFTLVEISMAYLLSGQSLRLVIE